MPEPEQPLQRESQAREAPLTVAVAARLVVPRTAGVDALQGGALDGELAGRTGGALRAGAS